MAKQDDWVRITLRLPHELHQQLVQASSAASMNAEIVHRLERTFEEDARTRFQGRLRELTEPRSPAAAGTVAPLMDPAGAASSERPDGLATLSQDQLDAIAGALFERLVAKAPDIVGLKPRKAQVTVAKSAVAKPSTKKP